ncbi:MULTISPECIES: NEL-type E3 ubiquitin ligase domain-containing protein [Yersinia pseudotuberculosis complex]|nr:MULTISPECIES: NEL-type E3 ubiquitin ligase domain-containing protein [Yersinia pseudotuberculosis complex]
MLQLAGSPTLREQTFLIAQESTETCDDRVALTYNHMQKAVMAHEVEKGEYDTQLPELMARGRELFRLEQLENIARAGYHNGPHGKAWCNVLSLNVMLLRSKSSTTHWRIFTQINWRLNWPPTGWRAMWMPTALSAKESWMTS